MRISSLSLRRLLQLKLKVVIVGCAVAAGETVMIEAIQAMVGGEWFEEAWRYLSAELPTRPAVREWP
jgi:MFS superfamily sulfate permease-like transporter